VKYIIRDTEANGQSPIGGKARMLAALQPAGLPIPSWFALTLDAFDDSLATSQRDASQRNRAPRCKPNFKKRSPSCVPGASWWLCVLPLRMKTAGAIHLPGSSRASCLFLPTRWRREWWPSGIRASASCVLAYRREHGLPAPPRALRC